MINEKRKQRELDIGYPSTNLNHNVSPPSRCEKWKRVCQRPEDEFTSEDTHEVGWKYCK